MKLGFFLTLVCAFGGLSAVFAQDAGFMTNVYGRDYQLLNGKWSVIVDQYELGESRQIYLDRQPANDTQFFEYSFEGGPRLNVPGDWNSQLPELKYYEGSVWYARHFSAEKVDGKRQFLYFGGVTYRCKVYLNGKEVAAHEGSFTPFQVEVTDLLNEGDNYLVVMVNNRRTKDAIPAMTFDWWNYGGITRDVMLIQTPEVYINDYFVRLSDEDRESVAVSVKLSAPVVADVKVEIPLLGISQTVSTGGNGEAEVNLRPENLRLWAPDDPYLYGVTLSCGQDSVSEEIGFRYLETRGAEILINGVPTFMRGVNFHEEIASRRGRAFSEDDAYMLLSEAKALGVNMVRLAHYPQNEYTVRLAEKMGIVLWEEIPVWQDIDFEDMNTKAKALSMLSEMIGRDKNRCAICFFSISNETYPSEPRDTFLTELLEHGKSLDPTRLFTSAFCYAFNYDEESGKCVIDDAFLEKLDVVGVNRYMGWYAPWPVDPSQVVWDIVPDRPLIVSEFGGEALYGQHGEGKAASEWSEEYQAKVYNDNIKMFNNIPNLAGVCPWALFDFQTPYRMNQINQSGWNRKGLVSEHGYRKQAWYVMHDYYDTLRNASK